MVPDDALWLAMYDMERERRQAPKGNAAKPAGARALLPAEVEIVRLAWIGIAARCELERDFFREAWIAGERDGDVLVAIEGNGIGDPGNLRCVFDRIAELDDQVEPDAIVPDVCGVQIDVDGDIHGFAPNRDLLVVGSQAVLDRARARATGGRRRGEHPLMADGPHRDSWVWGAADIPAIIDPEALSGALEDSTREDLAVFANIRSSEVDVRLGIRYAMSVSGTFATESDARAVEAVVRALIDTPPPGLPSWANEMVRGLDLSRDDTTVTTTLRMGKRDAYELGLVPSSDEAGQMPVFAFLSALMLL